MATSMTLDYDLNNRQAVMMLELLLASGLFKQRQPSIDAALDDVKAGRIHHYASIDDLKRKFAHV